MLKDIKKYVAKFPDKYIMVDDTIINLFELKLIIYKNCEYYNKRYIDKKEENNESR